MRGDLAQQAGVVGLLSIARAGIARARERTALTAERIGEGVQASAALRLGIRLRALAARAVTPAPAAVELGPVLEQLTQAVRTMGDRPVSVAVPAPVQALQRAAAGPVSSDMGRQLSLVENALAPLERVAKRTLQSGEENLKAMQVWQAVTEALELLQSLQKPVS